MYIRRQLIKLNWFLSSQLGIDPVRFMYALRGIPTFVCDWISFRKKYSGRMNFMPCLHDRYEEGGTTKNEYFWQDLLVARMIFMAKPEKHVDIGSRIDGFIAHLASFREIEVFDVRPITTQIPGIKFKQADLMSPIKEESNYCDSISCLHALEHFGLGRYNDPIDPKGFESGFANMAKLLKEKGFFYLSVPIGIERIEFNANRVFDPRLILRLATQHSLSLFTLTVIQSDGKIEEFESVEIQLARLAKQQYALGIFVFNKCPNLKETIV